MYQISFPAISRDGSWTFTGKITDLNDNPIDLTGMVLVFSVVDKRGWQRLKATTDDGSIKIVDVGTFRWFFSLQQMQSLQPATYQTGFTLSPADFSQTIPYFTGPLPIVSGYMTPWTPP